MASTATATPVMFRPNLAGFTTVKIRLPSRNADRHHDETKNINQDEFGEVQVNATNDFFTSAASNDDGVIDGSGELVTTSHHHHWMDLHFLRTMLGTGGLGEQANNRILNAATPRTLLGTYSSSSGEQQGDGVGGEPVLGTLAMPVHVSCKLDQDVTLLDPTVLLVNNTAVWDSASPWKRHPDLMRKNHQMVQEQSIRTFSTAEAVDNDEDVSHRERRLQRLAQQRHHQPLRITSSPGGDSNHGWVDLVLRNVAVVQNLPVPFHISFHALRIVPSGIVTLSTIPLSPRLFPKHYHSHAYWPNVARQLKELARQRSDPWQSHFEQQQQHRQQQQQQEPKQQPEPALELLSQLPTRKQQQQQQQQQRGLKRTCACCFQPNPKLQCDGGCENVFYCDKVCEDGHWKVHQKTCRKQQPAQQGSLKTFITSSLSASLSSRPSAAGSNKNRQPSKRTWW
jgi:MYND finger